MNFCWRVLVKFVLITVLIVRSHEAIIRHHRYKSLFPSNSSLFTSKPLHKHRLQNFKSFTHLAALKKVIYDTKDKSSSNLSGIANYFNLTTPKISSYQEYYQKYYGTRPGLQQIRSKLTGLDLGRSKGNYSIFQDLIAVREANEHLLMVKKEAKCEKPKPKVINVQDVIPDRSKEYLPRCTILYRCDGQTGCCDNEKFHCVAKTWKYVRLHFYTITVQVNPELESSSTKSKVESFLFRNHTGCRCEDAYDIPRMAQVPTTPMPPIITQSPTSNYMDAHNQQDYLQIHTKAPEIVEHTRKPIAKPTQKTETTTPRTTTPSYRISRCRDCPLPFTKRPFADGGCSCDCFDKQRECLRIKRGKLPLDDTERRCVEAKYCHEPECEYGHYIITRGRCPKRSERKNKKKKHALKFSSGRWKAHQRD